MVAIQQLQWRRMLTAGLFAGFVLVYVSMVGMLEAFNERDVIYQFATLGEIDLLTMGQILLFAPSVVIALFSASRLENKLFAPVHGLVIGLLSSILPLIMIAIASQFDLRDVFVSLTSGLLDILTFEQEDQLTGNLMLVTVLTVAGLVGGSLMLIPHRIRNPFLVAVVVVLGVGLMGELVNLALQQFVSEELLDQWFRRDVLRRSAAVGLFAITFALLIFWTWQGNNIRQWMKSRPSDQKRYIQGGGFSVLGLVLLVLPWLVGSFLSEVMSNVGLYVLMGLGLNIAIGLAGLLDLGYVTNFAIGAYVMGILTSTGQLGLAEQAGIGVFNFWLALPISILAAMLTGFLLAVPVLRMRGDYLAIATLGFGEIIRLLALSDWLSPVVGGAQGVLAIPKPMFFGTELVRPEQIYYLILAGCLLAVFVSTRLNNSRTGRQWMSIREDEDVAAAMGIDTARAKLLAFTLSAATGGLAGAIFAVKLGTIFPHSFNLLISVNVLSLIIVGGMGSTPGIVLGALFLIGLPELLREFSEYRLLLYGVLLVVMMRSRPEGIWPSAVHRREMHEGEQSSSTIAAVGD